MTIRQTILKAFYPLLTGLQRLLPQSGVRQNSATALPPVPFHSLSVTLNNGTVRPFSDWRGRKLLLVNTASDCGYTAQYAELQALFERTSGQLQIIAFPANDFKAQEQGSDEEIARFCAVNYGVRFPVAKKSVVVKTAAQNPVFRWLTTAAENGWNDQPPVWNFSKYLINEEGVLTHVFAPGVSPLSKVLLSALR